MKHVASHHQERHRACHVLRERGQEQLPLHVRLLHLEVAEDAEVLRLPVMVFVVVVYHAIAFELVVVVRV